MWKECQYHQWSQFWLQGQAPDLAISLSGFGYSIFDCFDPARPSTFCWTRGWDLFQKAWLLSHLMLGRPVKPLLHLTIMWLWLRRRETWFGSAGWTPGLQVWLLRSLTSSGLGHAVLLEAATPRLVFEQNFGLFSVEILRSHQAFGRLALCTRLNILNHWIVSTCMINDMTKGCRRGSKLPSLWLRRGNIALTWTSWCTSPTLSNFVPTFADHAVPIKQWKKPVWLGYIRDYTTHLYRDDNKPW